ncbi:hypothetical protein C2G38_2191453 [Gigaspora rosea]|uniref:Uncharacterized protein n=1 Tax=Gigaspora rosea TaxID=44941 RepID=A0A397V034_9GLOM|nr:hypothetical protein C2G38_2191453 [Gigaspora rosea]
MYKAKCEAKYEAKYKVKCEAKYKTKYEANDKAKYKAKYKTKYKAKYKTKYKANYKRKSTKDFAEKQREYVDKAKAHNVRNDAYEDDKVVIYETQLLINDNQRRLQFQALDNEVEYNESLIAEREGEIREIERNTSIRTTIDVSFKAIASTCPNHHEEVYLVGWEGEPQPISLSTGTSRGTVPGLRAGCSSNHQYFREVFHLALTQVSLFELE